MKRPAIQVDEKVPKSYQVYCKVTRSYIHDRVAQMETGSQSYLERAFDTHKDIRIVTIYSGSTI